MKLTEIITNLIDVKKNKNKIKRVNCSKFDDIKKDIYIQMFCTKKKKKKRNVKFVFFFFSFF